MKAFAVILFAIMAALQWRLWFGSGAVNEVKQLASEVAIMEEKNRIQMQRNQVLQAEVADLKDHLAALEERARTNLGMVQKGETFYQNVE